MSATHQPKLSWCCLPTLASGQAGSAHSQVRLCDSERVSAGLAPLGCERHPGIGLEPPGDTRMSAPAWMGCLITVVFREADARPGWSSRRREPPCSCFRAPAPTGPAAGLSAIESSTSPVCTTDAHERHPPAQGLKTVATKRVPPLVRARSVEERGEQALRNTNSRRRNAASRDRLAAEGVAANPRWTASAVGVRDGGEGELRSSHHHRRRR